eukprot:gene5101-6348_t
MISEPINGNHKDSGYNSNNMKYSEQSPLLAGADQIGGYDTIDSPPNEQQTKKFAPVPAFWNTVKAFAGAGSFSLPWAVSNAGLWIGSIGLVLVAILSNYTMSILLKCSIKTVEDRIGSPTPSYADLAKRAYGRPVGQNLGDLIPLSNATIIWIVLPVITLLTFLTDMKYLGFTSIFGALSLILAMVTVVVYGIKEHSVHALSDYKFDPANIPLWFGNAAFFFCNHIVVIPISHASGDIKRYPRVLDSAMVFITIINTAFAVICYLYFDQTGIPDNIVDALPKNNAFADIVRVCVVFELICSFPLVCGAGIAVVDSSIQFFRKHFSAYPPDETLPRKFYSKNWKFYAIRLVINCILAAIATTIKQFGSYSSLIGSLMLAIAGFVVPPLLYIRFFPDVPLRSKIFHIVITIFGVGATIVGTYLALKNLIHPPPGN